MKSLFKILILIALFISIRSYAQDLKRKDLISQLKADKESLFVINGIAFSHSDSLKLDVELKRISNRIISEITVLKNEEKIPHQRNDVIIIEYASKLTKTVITEKLIEIQLKFTDKYYGSYQHIFIDAKDPVLYVNGNKIHHTEIENLLKNIKVKNIGYIYCSKTLQSQELHGQNAKNGIVIIWTNDKLIE